MIGDLIASRTRPRVLDLGCGAGMIDEYLSDECVADVTGIDVVTAGIRLARDRTKDKRERLRFFLKDMREYPQDPTGYDMIMSLDTLYFLGAEGNGLLFEKRYAEAAAFAGMASDGTLTRYLYSTVPR